MEMKLIGYPAQDWKVILRNDAQTHLPELIRLREVRGRTHIFEACLKTDSGAAEGKVYTDGTLKETVPESIENVKTVLAKVGYTQIEGAENVMRKEVKPTRRGYNE